MKMTGNTILITGGTSGIGRGLAEALHDRGNRVVVAGRRRPLLDEVTAARPGMVGLPLDLDNPAAPAHLGERVRADFPDTNVLVANAGISRPEDLTADDWDGSAAADIVGTNVMGVIRTVAAVLPVLKRRPDPVVMVTTSNLAFIPRADFPTYCASKAFLHSWLQSLRHQLRHVPVQVLELSPPYVRTELTGKHQATDARAVPLADYVAEVMGLLAAGNHPNGEVLVERDKGRRTAEREGRYDAMFTAINGA